MDNGSTGKSAGAVFRKKIDYRKYRKPGEHICKEPTAERRESHWVCIHSTKTKAGCLGATGESDEKWGNPEGERDSKHSIEGPGDAARRNAYAAPFLCMIGEE